MSRLQKQRSSTLLKYGYNRDATGNLSVDPNNEYGSYQQMLKGESGQVEGLGRAQAASGWGGESGYLGQQREDLAHAQGGEQAALGQGLTGELTAVDQGEEDAAFNKDSALYQAQLDAANRAADANQFNPADYSGLNQPEYGADVTTPPVAKGPGKAPKAVPKKVTNSAHQVAKKQLINKVRKNKKGR